jgi:hypothetical protein
MKNGSVFFLDAGKGPFAVTAAHVVTECFEDSKSSMFVQCMIGSNGGLTLPIHLGDRIIAVHPGIDIATFRVTPDELVKIGRTPVTGFQKAWPPPLPQVDRGATYCGFPGNGRRVLGRREISFGIVGMGGIVTSAHETCISIQIEREHLIRVLGIEEFTENYDFGGMSGGPLLANGDASVLDVVFQGPNPSGDPENSIQGFEIIRARPVHFINPDGMLDVARWENSNLASGANR